VSGGGAVPPGLGRTRFTQPINEQGVRTRSRRDQWKEIQQNMFGEATRARSVEERETVPDRACGVCRNFSENAYASDGRGSCRVLKSGSDIAAEPPVYVLEGETGLISFFNRDAARCGHFERMTLIDRDGSECADPAFLRWQRQMEKAGK